MEFSPKLHLTGNEPLIIKFNVFAKRRKGQPSHLEMLLAPRDANNGNTKEQAEKCVHKPGKDTSTHEPDEIHKNAEATSGACRGNDSGAKRPKAEQPNLECLHRKRDADDSNGQSQTTRKIAKGCLKAATQQPYNVSKRFHIPIYFSY